MAEVMSDQDQEIRRKYQCGYYTLSQVQEVYSLSRKEAVDILCREPSVIDHQRWELEMLSYLKSIP